MSAGGMVTAALVGVLVELVRRQSSVIDEVRAHTQEARDQVANDHGTNLRDDLDKVSSTLAQVLEGQTEYREQVKALRAELAHERAERLAVSARLDTYTKPPAVPEGG
ncbi:DUF2746 domain-containing protein [Streptomyces sp. NPDC003691]